MPAPQNATLPPFFTLANGYTVRVTALDPTNGNVVTGVIASNVSLAVDQKPAQTANNFLVPAPLLIPSQT